jgi:hypothetical protein
MMFAVEQDSQLAMSGAQVLKYLQNHGEKISTEELTSLLKLLMVEPAHDQVTVLVVFVVV